MKSTRLPGKPLADICGKSMILWVAEAAENAVGKASVYVATDDQRIASAVRDGGFSAIMTSASALTGTDRVAEAAVKIDADIILNVQGDEPLIESSDIVEVIEKKQSRMGSVVNGYSGLLLSDDPWDTGIPKVVINENSELVYMSRLPIPGHKMGASGPKSFLKQVCVYAYTKDQLERFVNFGRKSVIEDVEDIEILRFFELQVPVQMIELSQGSIGVDTPEDLQRVNEIMSEKLSNESGLV